MPAPELSVVVTTRNRRDELLRALRSVAAQDIPAGEIEIVICDDASGDGTAAAVADAFPGARVLRVEAPRGVIAGRNAGARAARAPIVCFIDDDSELVGADTLSVARRGFDEPRVGVVAIAAREPGRGLVCGQAPEAGPAFVTDTFAGCACLVDRAVFLGLGGFREELGHRGEETEFARRLYRSGRVVRLSTAPVVEHRVSAARSRERDVLFQARAQVLGTVFALPWRTLPWRALLSLGHGARNGQLTAALRGLVAGARDGRRLLELRDPLPGPLYRAHRRLERERVRRGGPRYTLRLADVEPALSEMVAVLAP